MENRHSSAPPPSTFEATWSPSRSVALDPARLVITKREPRMWERAPYRPTSQDSRFKVIWKRYEIRPKPRPIATIPPLHSSPILDDCIIGLGKSKSPERAVKRLRVASGTPGQTEPSDRQDSDQPPFVFVPTKWERRRSTSNLPRKQMHMNTREDTRFSVSLSSTPSEVQSFPAISPNNVSVLVPNQQEDDSTLEGAQISTILESLEEAAQRNHDEAIKFAINIEDELPTDIDDRIESTVAAELLQPEDTYDRNYQAVGVVVEVDATIESDESVQIAWNEGICNAISADYCAQATSADETVLEEPALLLHPCTSLIDDMEQDIASNASVVVNGAEQENQKSMSVDVDIVKEILATVTDTSIGSVNNADIVESILPDVISALDDIENRDPSQRDISAIQDEKVTQVTICIREPDPLTTVSHDKADTADNVTGVSLSPTSRMVQRVTVDPPSPTLEDVTATITLSSLAQLEDDKAILRSFLDRMAVNKETKTVSNPVETETARRESLQNRRDSDVVRQALASPRQPLEDKDGNTFSPRKVISTEMTASPLVKSVSKDENAADLERIIPPIDELLAKPSGKGSPRRSSRARSNKPSQSTVLDATDRKQIAVRRNDGNDTINLTKTEAQVLAMETRRNTRKNKGSCLNVQDRLVKWRAELVVYGKDGDTPEPKQFETDQKGVRWSANLWFLNETTGVSEQAPLLDNAAAPTPKAAAILLPAPDSSTDSDSTTSRPKRVTRTQTPKVRRLRGLGTTNGTPAKSVLASTILPDELGEPVEEISKTAQSEKATTIAASTVSASSVRSSKSKLQQPTKFDLNPSVKSVTVNIETKVTMKKGAPAKKTTASEVGPKKAVSMLPVAGASNRRTTRRVM